MIIIMAMDTTIITATVRIINLLMHGDNINQTIVRARYGESDQMGFIHHSVYIMWMELGRINLMRDFGIEYRKVELEGLLMPVLQADVKYVSPAFFDDEVKILTGISKFSGSRLRMDYRILRSDDTLLAKAFTEHCFIKKSDYKPLRIPDNLLQKFRSSEKAAEWSLRKL
ncbi:MAG: acyl-CoA thioesterase [Ignavibacteriales bacterium]|nr:acyl-CoA thioesterase [Ignavibacteriales bacterium]MCF8314968.1 acyl-CoA thioesterase [Ignavibacteriales bacterium]MCF8436083.1 acyl-CoA thioesterase [Ignavibacteriales bacterium]